MCYKNLSLRYYNYNLNSLINTLYTNKVLNINMKKNAIESFTIYLTVII